MPNPVRWKPAHIHIALKGIHTYSVEVPHVQYLSVSAKDDGHLVVSPHYVLGIVKAYQVYAHAMRGERGATYLGTVFRTSDDHNQWCCVFACGKFYSGFDTTRRGAIERLMTDFFAS